MNVGRNWKVAVATTFVPDSEPLEMLEATVKALVDLDYPHDTWVLDEGDEEAVRDLCAKLGARHFSRKNRPEYQGTDGPFRACTKYGNYNSWLAETGFENYDIVTAFDPDHRPAPQFLRSVLGYFEDPRTATCRRRRSMEIRTKAGSRGRRGRVVRLLFDDSDGRLRHAYADDHRLPQYASCRRVAADRRLRSSRCR